ncbi:hypothetical protein POJ06DRAFT_120959 [Lipomyces tetrasporus]|uniref:BRCT domain-containing protein n=1 Tax=Lipomyces tetrasporus TaxID=54092 RepID=A0AAD7QRN8_9ASCO|nr:uncharacterized protein POJ06DRAFT_120959 [Lipomyces tetrasporus]KAJ8099976.1 hypothetical protein POJ06DRAFT_120959 [Lipomyces tetrasporus]
MSRLNRVGETAEDSLDIVKMQEEYKGKLSQGSEHDDGSEDGSEEDIVSSDDRVSHNSHVSESIRDRVLKDSIPKSGPYIQSLHYSETQKDSSESPEEEMNSKPGTDQSDHALHEGSTIVADTQLSRASSNTPSGQSDDSNGNNAGIVDVPKDPTKVSQSSPLFPSSTEVKRYETPNYKITLSQIFNEPSPDSPTPLEFRPPQQTPNKQRYVPLADSQERRMKLRNVAAGQEDPFEKEFVPGPVNLTKASDAGLSKVFGRGATRLVNVQKLPPHFGRQDARAAGLREPDQITLQLPLVPPQQQRAGRVLTHVSASEDDSSGRPSGGGVLDPAVTHDEIDHASDSSDVGDAPNDDSESDNTTSVGHADLTNSRHLRSPELQVPRTQDENNEGEPNSDTLDETQHITDPGSQFSPFTNHRASPSQRLPPSSPQKMHENQTARPSSSPAILSPRSLHSRRQSVSTDTPGAVAATDAGHGRHSEIIDLSSSAAAPSLRSAPLDHQQSPTRSRIAPPLETDRAKKKRKMSKRKVKEKTNSKQDSIDIVIPESIEESPQLTKGDAVGTQSEPPQPQKQQQPQPPPTLISKMPKQKSRKSDQSKRAVDIFEFLETDERRPNIPAPPTTRKSGHSDIEVELTSTAKTKGQAVVKKRKRTEAPPSGDDGGNRRGESKRRRTRETSSDQSVENMVEATVEEDIPETVAIPDTVQITEEHQAITAGVAEPAEKDADITQREDHEELDELAEPAVETHRSITSSSSLSSLDDDDSRVSSFLDSEDDYVEGSDKMKPPADQSTRQERRRTTSRASVTTPDPRRPNFDATNIMYPDRAFGLWTGTRQGYYPCRILPQRSAMLLADRSQSRKVDVEFDDGSRAKLDPQHIRSLDLRLGDQIKIDKVGQRSNWYEIVGLMVKPVDDVKSFKPCIRGNNVLRVRMKGAPNSAKTPTATSGAQEEQEMETEVEKIYVPNVKWHQFTQRAVPEVVAACVPSLAKYALRPTLADDGVEVASARNERMRSVSSDVPQLDDELPRTRTPIVQYGMSPGRGVSATPVQHWNTQQSGIVKSNVKHGIFSGSAFALSGYSDKTRVELQNIIISNGGWYFVNGLIDLFVTDSDPVGGGVKVLPRRTELQSLRFAAVVSEVCTRRLKYLNAIALGWPCITSSFLIRSSEASRVLPWWEHRVAHTGELRTLIQSDTSLFVLGFGKGWDLWSMYTRRFKLLYGLNVVILRSGKGQAKAKSNEGSSATLISMMGPNMIAFANDTKALTALLSEADLPSRQPNIPGVTYSTLAAPEESYEDLMYANARSKLQWDYVYVEGEKSMRTSVEGQVGQQARVLDKTGLIMCMSVGRIV